MSESFEMAIRFGKVLVVAAASVFLLVGSTEVLHRRKYGHFVAYGIHTDVILGNSDVGMNDTYWARLENFSFGPLELVGCVFPNDVIGEPNSILFHWDVQKRAPNSTMWVSLRGADNWVEVPFGGTSDDTPCRPTKVRLMPFQSRIVAWVFDTWVTTGEPVRLAIHTSATTPPEHQKIIYTDTFIVKQGISKPRQSR